MNPQPRPPTFVDYNLGIDDNIEDSQYMCQAVARRALCEIPPGEPYVPPDALPDILLAPYAPQYKWRMPTERMELMCSYLTRRGKENAAKSIKGYHQSHRHCTREDTLSESQMDTLVEKIVSVLKRRGGLYGDIDISRWDWDAICAAYNKEIGGKTNVNVLRCAVVKQRYKYVVAIFRERCKLAAESQPELGEEYWHWLEV